MIEMHLDSLGGIAGDMFVAALLDARPDLGEGLRAALAQCPLIEQLALSVEGHNDGILTGTRFIVTLPGALPPQPHRHAAPHDHVHGHDHEHHHDDHHHHDHSPHDDHAHVDWLFIRHALETSALDSETIRHAVGIFTLLAEAEARVHGVTPDAVQFHEVGAWDSVADIVAASWLIARMNATRWTVAPLPLGGGRIRSAHGQLPVPAPATALLLEGFQTVDDGITGERVTPTGAAILRHLCRTDNGAPTPRRLIASGHGFGSKRLPGISNCLRLLVFERAEVSPPQDQVAVLECEIDDQTGEDLAHAIDLLRNHAGVIDVVQMPVFGKKGRIMTHLRVLAEPAARETVIAAIFDETTTIGIRHMLSPRSILPREIERIAADDRLMRVKRVERPSGPGFKVEADDLADVRSSNGRRRLRRLAEAQAEKIPETK